MQESRCILLSKKRHQANLASLIMSSGVAITNYSIQGRPAAAEQAVQTSAEALFKTQVCLPSKRIDLRLPK
jgi:hypothetical protein